MEGKNRTSNNCQRLFHMVDHSVLLKIIFLIKYIHLPQLLPNPPLLYPPTPHFLPVFRKQTGKHQKGKQISLKNEQTNKKHRESKRKTHTQTVKYKSRNHNISKRSIRQKYPNKLIRDKTSTKLQFSSFCIGHLLLGMMINLKYD